MKSLNLATGEISAFRPLGEAKVLDCAPSSHEFQGFLLTLRKPEQLLTLGKYLDSLPMIEHVSGHELILSSLIEENKTGLARGKFSIFPNVFCGLERDMFKHSTGIFSVTIQIKALFIFGGLVSNLIVDFPFDVELSTDLNELMGKSLTTDISRKFFIIEKRRITFFPNMWCIPCREDITELNVSFSVREDFKISDLKKISGTAELINGDCFESFVDLHQKIQVRRYDQVTEFSLYDKVVDPDKPYKIERIITS